MGLYDYSKQKKKSILFGTSNNTPMQWTLNFILPKGTTLLILNSFCNSNPIFFVVPTFKCPEPRDSEATKSLQCYFPGYLSLFQVITLSTPP